MTCHHKCQSKMPNLCGVNQKLFSDALAEIDQEKKKRGTSASSISPPQTPQVQVEEDENLPGDGE